jgi:hypothetical protein
MWMGLLRKWGMNGKLGDTPKPPPEKVETPLWKGEEFISEGHPHPPQADWQSGLAPLHFPFFSSLLEIA